MDQSELEGMDVKELKKLRRDVDKAIETYEERSRREAMKEVERIAKEHGISVGELIGGKSSRKKSAPAPKYRHPDNPELTWSGRGRKPGWLKEQIEQGRQLEDLAI